MSCASGTIAIGDGVPADPRRLRRRDDRRRRRGAARAALLRRVRAHPRDVARATTTRARASRPFDRDRDGFVMGEGAAVLMLEECERARRARRAHLRRGRRLRHHQRRAPHDGAAARTARRPRAAMRTGARTTRTSPPAEVDYVNAHGSSTPLNDPTETLAIKQVFGEHALPHPGQRARRATTATRSARRARSRRRSARSRCERGWLPPTREPRDPGRGVRPGLRARRPGATRARGARADATRSGSAASTPRW